MTDSPHPAQSSEFLSLLHDGELPSAEAAAFEAHRRSCEACRRDVEAYERTLSAFRAAPTAAPASDLSARILRKIRAQSPSRRPFGVMFGIDLRWAGVFATALLVVIIATSLPQSRSPQQVAATPTAGPLSAYLVDSVESSPEDVARNATARKNGAAKAREDAPAAPRQNSAPPAKESRLASVEEARAPAPPPAPAPQDETASPSSTLSSQKTEAKAAPKALRRSQAHADPAGGEAGASAFATERGAALRLLITTLDSQGAPPPLESGGADDRLAPLRGQEFILLIESQGRVRSVSRSGPREEGALNKDKRADVEADAEASPAVEALRELRFRPGDRPRRLLVRVE